MHAAKPSVQINESAVFSRIDDSSGVVLEMVRKRYYMLSETGTAILEMLHDTAPRAVEDIVDALLDDFDLDRETLARDVAQYLKELERRRVVTLFPATDRTDDPYSETTGF